MTELSPFLKWAGGKQRLLPVLLDALPTDCHTRHYVEPFMGAAALFFGLDRRFMSYTLGDANGSLVNVFTCIRDQPEAVEDFVGIYSQLSYADLRAEFNRGRDHGEASPELAAMFLLLNRRGFNGLYRVNKSGKFNVPVGSNQAAMPPSVHPHSQALAGVALLHGSWKDTMTEAYGDGRPLFVYFDPPYLDTFSSYTAGGFTEMDHSVLADACKSMQDDIKIMLSNIDTPETRRLYAGLNIRQVDTRMSVSRGERGARSELLVTNY